MVTAGLCLTVITHQKAAGVTAPTAHTGGVKNVAHYQNNAMITQPEHVVKDIYVSRDVPSRFNTIKNLIWLSRAVHHEARGEGEIGWNAVADVIIQRAMLPNYPDTIYGVLSQPNQFGWYAYKDKREFPFHEIDPAIIKFCKKFLKNEYGLLPEGLANTFFEGDLSTNSWFRNALRTGKLINPIQIGNQTFATSKEDQAFLFSMREL